MGYCKNCGFRSRQGKVCRGAHWLLIAVGGQLGAAQREPFGYSEKVLRGFGISKHQEVFGPGRLRSPSPRPHLELEYEQPRRAATSRRRALFQQGLRWSRATGEHRRIQVRGDSQIRRGMYVSLNGGTPLTAKGTFAFSIGRLTTPGRRSA